MAATAAVGDGNRFSVVQFECFHLPVGTRLGQSFSSVRVRLKRQRFFPRALVLLDSYLTLVGWLAGSETRRRVPLVPVVPNFWRVLRRWNTCVCVCAFFTGGYRFTICVFCLAEFSWTTTCGAQRSVEN